jgi:hypothetical protein
MVPTDQVNKDELNGNIGEEPAGTDVRSTTPINPII